MRLATSYDAIIPMSLLHTCLFVVMEMKRITPQEKESVRARVLRLLRAHNYLWQKAGEEIAKRWDDLHDGNFKEVWHGEYAVEINKDVETVFNFVTRLAQYPLWHHTYTDDSHVIHVSGEYIFITPEVIGSVFRLDEIVDGYHLLSNAVITDFERNKIFKWKAPFSMLPIAELGTCLKFEQLKNGKTRLSEYFFFSESPVKHIFVNRKWFSEEALTNHIREELTGVKNILESGSYSDKEVTYLWEGVEKTIRFYDNKAYEIEHVNDSLTTHFTRARKRKGSLAGKLFRLLKARSAELQETTSLQENSVGVSGNIHYDSQKEVQIALVEAERKKAEALMEMQKRRLIC